MRGIAATLGIVKGKAFAPDAALRGTLDRAARVAFAKSRAVDYGPHGVFSKLYRDRQWLNPFPGGSPWFAAPTFDQVDLRTAYFSIAYSTSPGMAVNIVGEGAKYPFAFTDAQGNFLFGANTYRLHLPKGIPAKLFWSATVYDALTASGLDNGQPFPSINAMDKPATNADGSTDIYFGPVSPGEGKNWLRTVTDKGFFVALRLYGPTEPFFNHSWRPGDIEKLK